MSATSYAHSRPTALVALASLAACGGGGGSGGPSGTVVPVIQFAEGTSAPLETSGTLSIALSISEAGSDPISLPFTLGGSAVAGSDYQAPLAPALAIPAGDTTAAIEIQLLDDDVAFGPIDLQVTLGTPTGATLGAATSHTANIVDNEEPIQELDPNENLPQAAKNGPMAELVNGSVISIAGNVAQATDLFDVHRLQVPDTAGTLFVTATFVGPHPDLLVSLANAQGVPYGDAQDPDSVAFEVDNGRLYLVVQSTGAASEYQVRLEADQLP